MRFLNLGSLSVVLLVILASLSIGGCATPSFGSFIDPVAVKSIKKGTTTRAEVIAKFGMPIHESAVPMTGQRIMSFSYTESQQMLAMPGSTHQYKNQQLQVTLDKNGIVKDYQFNNGLIETHQGMGAFGGQNVRMISNDQ